MNGRQELLNNMDFFKFFNVALDLTIKKNKCVN